MQKKSSTRWTTAHVLLIIVSLAVALAEVAFIVRVVQQRGIFDYVGLDYRGSRAAGEAIAEHGFAGLSCFRGLRTTDRRESSLAWLGLAAATCAFSWHSHIHQLLLLLAPLYLVIAVRPQLKEFSAGVCISTSTMFLLAALTLTVGHAHNLLGVALLAGLFAISTICGLGLRSGSKTPL